MLTKEENKAKQDYFDRISEPLVTDKRLVFDSIEEARLYKRKLLEFNKSKYGINYIKDPFLPSA